MIQEIKDKEKKKEIAKKILLDLPEWFGIEEYTNDYIETSGDLPFFAVLHEQNDYIGFVSLKETSPYTAEIYCMGILKVYHKKGYGRQLYSAIEKYAADAGYKFMQVKTVKQGTYDNYDKTNAFYKNMGFYELEVFPELWDDWNPCQVYVKSL